MHVEPWPNAGRGDKQITRPALTPDAQSVLRAEGHVAEVCSITVEQVAGLIGAISSLSSRSESGQLPVREAIAAETRESLADLLRAFRGIAARIASGEKPGVPVFTDPEQAALRLHKYVRNHTALTTDELSTMIDLLGAYASHARPYPLYGSNAGEAAALVGVNRCLHAHNAILTFYASPFTLDEFEDDLHRTVFSKFR